MRYSILTNPYHDLYDYIPKEITMVVNGHIFEPKRKKLKGWQKNR